MRRSYGQKRSILFYDSWCYHCDVTVTVAKRYAAARFSYSWWPHYPQTHTRTHAHTHTHTHTHTHPFNGPWSGTTQVSRYQKGKTNLDFIAARDSEWQWHQLGCMQVCTSLQTDNHASNPPLSFLQAGCPSCHPINSVKALKATSTEGTDIE